MELKANELRLNNLCYRTNKLTKEKIIIELTASCILDISANGEMSSFIYEPIPLTEEWLLKFGFEKKESIWFLNEIQITSWFTFRFSLEPLKVQEIDYVHQLQNLYFVLTNKELEIKM